VSLSYLFLIFLIYSFIGWVSEVIYCSIIQHKLVNRGFLHGPICPIYGFGGLLVVFCLEPFAGNLFYLFVMAVIVTSTLEYVTSWVLETIFATKWWDYSNLRFNLHGRICLINSILFGIMGVLGIKFLHPAVFSVLDRIPVESRDILAGVLGVVMLIDLVVTLRALVDFEAKLASLTEFMESVKTSLDVREWFNELDLKGSLERLKLRARTDNSERTRQWSERLESLVSRQHEMVRLMNAFPRLKSRRHAPQVDIFRSLHSIAGWPSKALNVASSAAEAVVGSISTAVSGQTPAAEATATTATAESRKHFFRKSAVAEDLEPATGWNRAYELFWVFFIASYIGLILESLWCVVTRGYLESRSGLVYGMLNPVYGGGAVLMTLILARRQRKGDLGVFVGGMLIGGFFEYLISLSQELLFSSVSWEYSQTQLNLHGRTNLMFSLIWGFLALVWVRYLYPGLVRFIRKIPAKFGHIVAIVLAVLLTANIGISALAVHRWSERASGDPAGNSLDSFLDERYPDERLKEIYPNLVFVNRKN
jgi:uncharacterized membrane protein